MSRQKKKPDYDAGQIMVEFLNAITEAFGLPYDDRKQESGCPGLNRVAREFGITPLKARKLLITASVYSTETARTVHQLQQEGRTVAEIQELMHLSRASVHSYLPYQKAVYKLDELSTNAERTRLYRERQQAVSSLERLKDRVQSEGGSEGSERQQELLDEALWHTLVLFQKYPFHTAKKLEFTYTIKGHEIFVDRKEKSITKSTVLIAFHKALELGADATGPKKLGTFGASYLYPVFVRFGIIEAG